MRIGRHALRITQTGAEPFARTTNPLGATGRTVPRLAPSRSGTFRAMTAGISSRRPKAIACAIQDLQALVIPSRLPDKRLHLASAPRHRKPNDESPVHPDRTGFLSMENAALRMCMISTRQASTHRSDWVSPRSHCLRGAPGLRLPALPLRQRPRAPYGNDLGQNRDGDFLGTDRPDRQADRPAQLSEHGLVQPVLRQSLEPQALRPP